MLKLDILFRAEWEGKGVGGLVGVQHMFDVNTTFLCFQIQKYKFDITS
jgi:hypothetical protein